MIPCTDWHLKPVGWCLNERIQSTGSSQCLTTLIIKFLPRWPVFIFLRIYVSSKEMSIAIRLLPSVTFCWKMSRFSPSNLNSFVFFRLRRFLALGSHGGRIARGRLPIDVSRKHTERESYDSHLLVLSDKEREREKRRRRAGERIRPQHWRQWQSG